MRGWMIVAACTLPFAALAQPTKTATTSSAAAPASADAGASAPAPAAVPAAAAETPPAPTAPAPVTASAPAAGQGFGSQTRFWLTTQTSGASAVTEERPMPGEAATLVYQRYLNSFTHPIPERYESDSFKTSGSAR